MLETPPLMDKNTTEELENEDDRLCLTNWKNLRSENLWKEMKVGNVFFFPLGG